MTAVSVDGGTNSPGTDQNADGEVMLDIEVLGAVAPGAKIVVYFAPNTDQGFIDALSTAVHDTTNKPSVVSISWGGPEDSWTAQARTQMEQILTEGAAAGVTVTVASGDNGSTDGVTDGKQHVDFPASAPHALGCGGTTLNITNGQISSETVWNELPERRRRRRRHQHRVPGAVLPEPRPRCRTTSTPASPAAACPTSPATPIPRPATRSSSTEPADRRRDERGGAAVGRSDRCSLNASLGKPVGFLQPQIYVGSAAGGFHDITQGDNPAYKAGPGWDACSGNGSPNGGGLLTALGGS